ncbi:PTS sugar transporter subunit IIA [Lactobacillus sp. ESL0791]|uniref:PTS sugar transporter subunit IIA n=1 Tax=Lactobacillus sp. ESL0791 TaxID=2983234 RepID=UPI0023F922C8|nr:PTS sugar transporter subunit IIA [Lactobacillus sp. ESL0791]MDF7638092.1 PTS sugar transporter subunit IIA [Lactobacillus sp. ESL0791]
MKIVLIGHGKTGIAFKEAIEMIFGKADDVLPLTFLPGEGLKDVNKKIQNAIVGVDPQEILVVTDLFSGTPYNAAAELALKGEVKDVIAGMSLPILLDIVTNMTTKSVEEIAATILQDSSSYTKVLSDELNKAEKEDDF